VQLNTSSVARLMARGEPASPWQRRMSSVESAEQVVALTRDYLAAFSPENLGRLPEDCRPMRIKYVDDIEYWAHQLAQRYSGDNEEPVDGDLLQQLRDYFLHALIRLAELHRNLPGAPRIKAQ
jgi:hypothetical protein